VAEGVRTRTKRESGAGGMNSAVIGTTDSTRRFLLWPL
jgi:hypothetical protein